MAPPEPNAADEEIFRERPEIIGLVRCAYCNDLFSFDFTNYDDGDLRILCCPHCTQESAIGENGFRQVQSTGKYYYIVSFTFLLLALGITFGTYAIAGPGQIYIVYIGGFIVSSVYFIKGCKYRGLEMSPIQPIWIELNPATVTVAENA